MVEDNLHIEIIEQRIDELETIEEDIDQAVKDMTNKLDAQIKLIRDELEESIDDVVDKIKNENKRLHAEAKDKINKLETSHKDTLQAIKKIADAVPGIDEIVDNLLKVSGEKFKLSTKNIDGLDQTIAAFSNQLGNNKTYLHGGGDTVTAGTNVTITTNATGQKVISATGTGGGVWGSITGTLSDQTDLQTALDAKVAANSPITGATKTKITYDSDGLVTSGSDATTADIADSTNKRYVTDAQLTVIGNTSGTNTGDQTITLTGDVTGSGTGSFSTTIANNAVTTAKIINLAITDAKVNDVDWAKITFTPTTLSGYGITDAIAGSGVSGRLAVFSSSSAITSLSPSGTITIANIVANDSGGLNIKAANSTAVGLLGVGNTANVTWYGNHNFDTSTADTIASFGSSKTLQSLSTATYPSLAELSYVKGVTSSIQTQLNSKGSGTVTSVTGTTNRITSTGGTAPIIDISTSYVGQSSITTLGTITTGVWNGTTIAVANGGTGITSFGSGVATWLGTPSSANLRAAITDETGTGSLVFGTSPTFTTDITTPLIIGGTGTTSTLTLRTTSGVGTTNADMIFQVGNNGATEAMRITNGGFVGIGTTPTTKFSVVQTDGFGTYVDPLGVTVNSFMYLNPNITTSTFGTPMRVMALETVVNPSSDPGTKTVNGIVSQVTVPSGSVNLSGVTMRGLNFTVQHGGTGSINALVGLLGNATNRSTGTVTTATGGQLTFNNLGAGTITTAYGMLISDISNAGTITNTYGVYVGDITTGTQTNTPFSFYASDANTLNYFAGRTGIGTSTPAASAILDLTSTTGAFLPPRMTTTQRDALTAVDGMMIYNSTLATMQYRKAGAWVSI